MALKIVRNDITKMKTDAIVNTAGQTPEVGSGCDVAVYTAAGFEKLHAIRKEIGEVAEGEVFITPGLALPAKYIIHAVSPLYVDGSSGEEEKLRSCYRKSMQLAKEKGIRSIAFPLIATGSYGYPKEEGIRIAVDEINDFLLKEDMDITLVVFDGESTKLGARLYPDLEEYISHHYVEEHKQKEYGRGLARRLHQAGRAMSAAPVRSEINSCEALFDVGTAAMAAAKESCEADLYDEEEIDEIAIGEEISERLAHLEDPFGVYLLYLIRSKGKTNAEVYNNAFISKQAFAKLNKDPSGYHPDKITALRYCVGAHLNMDETKDLLARAGYALSPSDKRDIIFTYFISNEVFDIIEIDIRLEEHGIPCIIK